MVASDPAFSVSPNETVATCLSSFVDISGADATTVDPWVILAESIFSSR
jgi:hypothetical protein